MAKDEKNNGAQPGEDDAGLLASLSPEDQRLVAIISASVGATVKTAVTEALGDDPARDARVQQRKIEQEQARRRAEIEPFEDVVNAGCDAGEMMVSVRLRNGFTHRPGGAVNLHPSKILRKPKRYAIKFREAWSGGNVARWGKDGMRLLATYNALKQRHLNALRDYDAGERREKPAPFEWIVAEHEPVLTNDKGDPRELTKAERW